MITWKKLKKKWMKIPSFKKAYDELETDDATIRACIDARDKAASRKRTLPSAWARRNPWWRALKAPSLATLKRYAARVSPILRAWGATVHYLPPYSPDFNPIEPAWSIVKKVIRANAPRTRAALTTLVDARRHARQVVADLLEFRIVEPRRRTA